MEENRQHGPKPVTSAPTQVPELPGSSQVAARLEGRSEGGLHELLDLQTKMRENHLDWKTFNRIVPTCTGHLDN